MNVCQAKITALKFALASRSDDLQRSRATERSLRWNEDDAVISSKSPMSSSSLPSATIVDDAMGVIEKIKYEKKW